MAMLIPLLLLQAAAARPETTRTGAFQSPRVTESSGVAVSRTHSGLLWTLNDSGDGPFLYATDARGRDRGMLRVAGAEAVDWEDLALGPCPRQRGDCLYIGDTGNNELRRGSVRIYAVPEPDPPGTALDTGRVTKTALVLTVRYRSGPDDVEALYVSPRDSAVYLVSKGRNGRVRLYRVSRAAWVTTGRVQAELVQILPITPKRSARRLVTGAAARGDGALVAIRTYNEIYFFIPGPGGRLTPAARPVCAIAGLERQGEGIAFRDNATLILTSEADPLGPGPIHTVRCPG
ncbi:MAG: hypothetical protein ACREMF_04225 [Gemmatimonadales bacterium]